MHRKHEYWHPQVRHLMVEGVKTGSTLQELAALLNIHPKTIARWVKHDKLGHSLENEPKEGRPRVIDDATLERICAAVDANPFISNEELVRKFRLPSTPHTVGRLLREHDPPYTYKQAEWDSANYTSENLLLNVKWGNKIKHVPLDDRLYEDEAAILDNEAPALGRAVVGKRIYEPHKSRGKLFQYAITIDRHSLVHPPFISISSFKDDPFKDYAIQHVAPHVTDGTVVIWDQLGRAGKKANPDKQHFNPEVRAAIEARGGKLWLLPPYGKFWNPAEEVHAFLKGRVRKYYIDSPAWQEHRLRTRAELEEDLLRAADDVTEEIVEAAWCHRANGRAFKEHFPHLYKK
jgi:transposase